MHSVLVRVERKKSVKLRRSFKIIFKAKDTKSELSLYPAVMNIKSKFFSR